MTKWNRIFLISATALLGAAVTTGALAASKPYCKTYAKTAVSSYHQMKSQNLGCTGPRWHGWYDGHYQWCLSTSKGSAKSETLARKRTMFSNQC